MKKSRLIEIINEEIEDILHAHSKKHPWSGHEHGRNAILQAVDTCMPTYEEKTEPGRCNCECCASGEKDMTLENNSECFTKLIEMLKECKKTGQIRECQYGNSTVKLNSPMRGDVKKYKVYVEDHNGIVKKVNFGD